MTKTLTELISEYYALIGGEHHKDKDCHFYIEKIYRSIHQSKNALYYYGREPYWQFCHYGYCWSVENFFQDEENIQKYQRHFDKHKDKLIKLLKFNRFVQPRSHLISNGWMKGEKLISLSADIVIGEFPKRQTEQEAEQDMRNFLEWAIEKEKKNQLKQGNDGWGF